MHELEELVDAAQPNPLLRMVDALVERRDWDGLVDLAQRCREAVERGKQLWPIAEHINYRLALDAPGNFAGRVLSPEAGKFALGPLTEVAASGHTFDQVAPYVDSPQSLGYFAAERVLRGEDLREAPNAHPEILEMPLVLMDWEPAYALAQYKSAEADFPEPQIDVRLATARGSESDEVEDDDLRRALLSLVEVWIARSNGTADVSIVDGTALEAMGNLHAGELLVGKVNASEALSIMAWAAASGGARGARRGAAFGRFAAWWTASILCDVEWPADYHELEECLAQLRWYVWDPRVGEKGWKLYLAVESDEGWAAAIGAVDQIETD